MKTILSWTRYLLAVLLMLVGVLLTCYSAIANARLGGMRNATNVADVSPGENDNDSEYLEKRRAFLDRFFGTGPGSVSPSAYKSAVAAARALPLMRSASTAHSTEGQPGVAPWERPSLKVRTSGRLLSTRTPRARNRARPYTPPTAAQTLADCGAQLIAASLGCNCTRSTTAFMM